MRPLRSSSSACLSAVNSLRNVATNPFDSVNISRAIFAPRESMSGESLLQAGVAGEILDKILVHLVDLLVNLTTTILTKVSPNCHRSKNLITHHYSNSNNSNNNNNIIIINTTRHDNAPLQQGEQSSGCATSAQPSTALFSSARDCGEKAVVGIGFLYFGAMVMCVYVCACSCACVRVCV